MILILTVTPGNVHICDVPHSACCSDKLLLYNWHQETAPRPTHAVEVSLNPTRLTSQSRLRGMAPNVVSSKSGLMNFTTLSRNLVIFLYRMQKWSEIVVGMAEDRNLGPRSSIAGYTLLAGYIPEAMPVFTTF